MTLRLKLSEPPVTLASPLIIFAHLAAEARMQGWLNFQGIKFQLNFYVKVFRLISIII